MRALRFDDRLWLSTNEPEPEPAQGEALVKVRLAGICRTDLELTRGYMKYHGILGHEFVGELLADAGQWRTGQRVVGEINIACGRCDLCREGMPSHCRNRVVLGISNYCGAFADRLRLPIVNLHPVPDSVPDDVAVFTEPLAAALQVTATAPVHPTDRVILIGAGKLGLLIAQVLQRSGCDLIVLARQPLPIELLERWGIPYLDTRSADPIAALGGQSAHIVVDVTGAAQGFALALDLVRPRGAIFLKSTYAGLPDANLTKVVVDEIRIVGSRCGPFQAALRMMETRQIDVQSMIERCYSLDEAPTAFQHAAERGVLKVLLAP